MSNVLTTEYLLAHTLSSELAAETPENLSKYLERAESLVRAYTGAHRQCHKYPTEHPYPTELQLAIVYVVEYLYSQPDALREQITSEKIGDYSYSRASSELPAHLRAILDQFRTVQGDFNHSSHVPHVHKTL